MRNRPLLSVCLMVLCVMTTCIIWGGPKFIKELRPSQLEIHTVESDRVTFCGEIYRQEQKENCQMFYLKKNSIYSNVNNYKFQESKIIIYSNSKEKLHIGNKIKGQGEVSFFDEARNPGNFDQKFYYQKQGIHGKIWAEADDVDIVDERTDRLRDRLETLRARWKALLIKEMGEEDGAILAAILLGEKSEMNPETKELYQVNGIGHILAISGVKTLKLDIPLVPEIRINWAFVPLHIAIIYILKLCLDEGIIPRCRFPCSRGVSHKIYKLAKEAIIQRKFNLMAEV